MTVTLLLVGDYIRPPTMVLSRPTIAWRDVLRGRITTIFLGAIKDIFVVRVRVVAGTTFKSVIAAKVVT